VDRTSSWEASSHAAIQELPHLVWSPKVYHHVHRNLPQVRIFVQMHSVYTFPPYFPKSQNLYELYNVFLCNFVTSYQYFRLNRHKYNQSYANNMALPRRVASTPASFRRSRVPISDRRQASLDMNLHRNENLKSLSLLHCS